MQAEKDREIERVKQNGETSLLFVGRFVCLFLYIYTMRLDSPKFYGVLVAFFLRSLFDQDHRIESLNPFLESHF